MMDYRQIDMAAMADFIKRYGSESPDKMRLHFSSKKYSAEERDFYQFCILQIEARRKYKGKFKNILSEYPDFIFPDMLAGEQASHEAVAQYHSNLTGNCKRLVDLTCGLGIDFITIAIKLQKDIHTDSSDLRYLGMELNPTKAELLGVNCKNCGLTGFEICNQESIEFLSRLTNGEIPESSIFADGDCMIFADPARRSEGNERIHNPADCSPDIIGHWDLLKGNASRILVKNSPMLDPVRALELFPDISELHIVSFKNECKEVLAIYDRNFTSGKKAPEIICVNIDGDYNWREYRLTKDELLTPSALDIIDPAEVSELEGKYLYEPNSSIMKIISGVCMNKEFPDLRKLSPNCHLYVSDICHAAFPGRIMKIDKILNKEERRILAGMQLNVAVRNYPQSAEKLKKSLKVKSATSNDRFLYGATVTVNEQPVIFLASSLSSESNPA